jgi:hypothetical protein
MKLVDDLLSLKTADYEARCAFKQLANCLSGMTLEQVHAVFKVFRQQLKCQFGADGASITSVRR